MRCGAWDAGSEGSHCGGRHWCWTGRVSGIGQEDEAEGTEIHSKSLLRSLKGSGMTKVMMSG